MISDDLKVDLKKAIIDLIPYAEANPITRELMMVKQPWNVTPPPERQAKVPPYIIMLTIDLMTGFRCPMFSISAPFRPWQRTLHTEEEEDIQGIIKEVFPQTRLLEMKTLITGSTAYKLFCIPDTVPEDSYEKIKKLFGKEDHE
jgi:hypothetical protein